MQATKLISEDLFNEVISKAKTSERKRSNFNFHELSEVYQRFLNVLTYGTYVQPHKHIDPPKPETFLVLRGKLGFLIFNDAGDIIESHLLSEDGPVYGIDVQPGVWHSIVTLSDVCVCFEGKSGPYDPTLDKNFAPWAPSEADSGKEDYLQKLEKIFTTDEHR